MPSVECQRIMDLMNPEPLPVGTTKPGDLWFNGTNGRYVILVLGHTKNRRRKTGHTYVYMYHSGDPSLHARPCDLRDQDFNAMSAERCIRPHPWIGTWTLLGNIFDMLPLHTLVARTAKGSE